MLFKQEITEQEYDSLSDDEKRFYQRKLTKQGNYTLQKVASAAGVKNMAEFHNAGYKGLYNGETADDIFKRKKLRYREDILDRQAKVNKDGSINILSGFLKCECCNNGMIKRKSKDKVYFYCSNYYRNKTCENNKSMSENGLIEIIKEKLNLTDITRLELENKVKYIYIDKDKNVKIGFK